MARSAPETRSQTDCPHDAGGARARGPVTPWAPARGAGDPETARPSLQEKPSDAATALIRAGRRHRRPRRVQKAPAATRYGGKNEDPTMSEIMTDQLPGW